MKWSQFIVLYQKKKINVGISHASSYILTKIWTVKFMFLLQRQKMPELNPGERGTMMSRRAAGGGSQLFLHTLHCSLWRRLSRFLTCIHATNEKMNQRCCPEPRRLEQPANFLNLWFFFFSIEAANKPAEPILTYLCDMDTSSLCLGQTPWVHLRYIMNRYHIALCLLLKWESCRMN